MLISRVILTVTQTLQDILRALSNRLTFKDNFQCVILDVTGGLADTEFVVTHNLQVIPIGYIANASAGVVSDSNKVLWTSSTMRLKCSVSSASIRLVVF